MDDKGHMSEPLTAEQQAQLDELAQQIDEHRSKLQAAAAANARRVRAQEEAREKALTADTLESFISMAEKATGLSREEIVSLAEVVAAEKPAPVVCDPRVPFRRRAVESGVPKLYIDHVIEKDPVDCDPLRLVREHMARRTGGFLVLGGGKGTRKTGSACWMLGQVEGGIFVEACDLLSIAFHDRPMYLRLRRAKHVVLDDLGAEDAGAGNDDAHFKKILTTLWGGWYASGAYVVATGNISRAQLDAYGTRIKDRMDERGRFVTVGGESVRRGMRQHWLEDKDGDE